MTDIEKLMNDTQEHRHIFPIFQEELRTALKKIYAQDMSSKDQKIMNTIIDEIVDSKEFYNKWMEMPSKQQKENCH